MTIPVIGTAVVNNPYWVKKLYMSIDYPVDNFLIINNNGRGEIDDELDILKEINHEYVKNIKICHLPSNIGCGGAWNLIIKCHMHSSYWIIVNDDVSFDTGCLEEMHTTITNDPDIGIIHGNVGDHSVGSWDLFLISDHTVQNFGLFDENLYPAYCEDADYLMRVIHRPVKRIIGLKSNYFHGDGNKNQYYTHGRQTQKSEPELESKLTVVNQLNIEYLTEKWGPGWRMCDPNCIPFKEDAQFISTTTYDLKFVRQKNLGF